MYTTTVQISAYSVQCARGEILSMKYKKKWSTFACIVPGFALCLTEVVLLASSPAQAARLKSHTILVLISRTQQSMSNPTPPGETIDSGSAMSEAAKFAIANPHPEWTSGRTIDFCSTCIAHLDQSNTCAGNFIVCNNTIYFHDAWQASHIWWTAGKKLRDLRAGRRAAAAQI